METREKTSARKTARHVFSSLKLWAPHRIFEEFIWKNKNKVFPRKYGVGYWEGVLYSINGIGQWLLPKSLSTVVKERPGHMLFFETFFECKITRLPLPRGMSCHLWRSRYLISVTGGKLFPSRKKPRVHLEDACTNHVTWRQAFATQDFHSLHFFQKQRPRHLTPHMYVQVWEDSDRKKSWGFECGKDVNCAESKKGCGSIVMPFSHRSYR